MEKGIYATENYDMSLFLQLKGTVQAKNKNLYYSFDSDENLHTNVKSKIKWGNSHEFFSIFFIEKELFTENVKKWVSGNNGRTVQPTQLIRISIKAEFHALQNYKKFFFSNLILVFELYTFFQKI